MLPFFFGLFLGDGYANIRVRVTNSLLFTPRVIISLKQTPGNVKMLEDLKQILALYGVSANVTFVSRVKTYNEIPYNASTVHISISGLHNVISVLFPLLGSLKPFFFLFGKLLNLQVL